MSHLSKKSQRFVIISAIVGSIIEWYDVFLYIYWAPILAKYFFESESLFTGTIYAFFLNLIGFLARPLGGLIFGSIGDIYGRKKAFYLSIICISIPSFLISLIPSYAQIGLLAPILLLIARMLQGLPAGGEIPGVICYLIESAPQKRKHTTGSYSFYGVEIGIALALLEYLLIGHGASIQELSDSKWKLSFMLGGGIGIFGIYLRHKLHETPVFKHLETAGKITQHPIIQSFHSHKRQIVLGFLSTVLATVGFFAIVEFPGIYLKKAIGISTLYNSLIIIGLLLLSTITLPYFGRLGDRYPTKNLLLWSAVLTLAFSPVFYYLLNYQSLAFVLLAWIVLTLLLNIQFALLPSFLASLFPADIRYTCIGLSFNCCDSLIGGCVPILAYSLFAFTGNAGSFIFLIAIASIVAIFAFSKIGLKDHIA